MLERSRVLAPAYSLPLIVRMFTLHQSVAQNLSNMRLSTFEIGEVLLRSGSVTEISQKSLLYYMSEQMPYPAWFSCRHKSCPVYVTIGSLRNGVFERRPSTGSEVFFILKHLDAPKFVFLSVLTIIETSCPKKWAKSLLKNEKKHFRLTCVAEKRLCLSSLIIHRSGGG